MLSSLTWRSRLMWLGLVLVFFGGLTLRLHRLSERPMHTDEAVNAFLLGEVLRGEPFRYDSQDRHGPLLTAVAWVAAQARGQSDFAALDELIVTGPTRTNVNDFRAILILGASQTAGEESPGSSL